MRLYIAAGVGCVEWIYGVTQPRRTTNECAQASCVQVGQFRLLSIQQRGGGGLGVGEHIPHYVRVSQELSLIF